MDDHPVKRPDHVCVGVIVRPHGVRGLVRVKPFTADAEAVSAYGPVEDGDTGKVINLEVVNIAKGMVTARIEGITDRDQAEALRGTELWVPRSALPEPEEEEYYYHDLVGLRVEDRDGKTFATVAAVENYGAGDMIVLRLEKGSTVLVPFTREQVPEVDIKGGRIVVDPVPEEDEEERHDG